MAELDLGIFLGGLLHKGLVAEGIGEDDLAALVLGQVNGGIVAGAVLADIGDDDDLIIGEAEVLLHLAQGLDEVIIVGGVLIVQADETDLHGRLVLLVILGLVAAGAQCEHHDEREQHRYELFHSQLSLKYCLYLSALLAQRRYPSAAKKAHWQAQPVTALLPMRNREAARGRLPRNTSHR